MSLGERVRSLRHRPPARVWLGRCWDGARQIVYASPLWPYALGGRASAELAVPAVDSWPGSAERGQAILSGEFPFAGQTVRAVGSIWAGSGNAATWGSPAWLAELHGFGWLRDLRAVGTDAARDAARQLVEGWIDAHGRWNAVAWRPDILGRRLASWLGQHEFLCGEQPDAFEGRFLASLAQQARHLARAMPAGAQGADLILAIKGLIYSGVCLSDGEKRLAKALRLLEQELSRQVLPDGGHVERSPSVHMAVLRHLVDIRAMLEAGQVEAPAELQTAIDRMAPMLRFFRHADGGLVLFNGSNEEEPWLIDAVLARADARGKPLSSAPHSGFQRLSANRTLLLADTGAPPPPGLDAHAHAGTLSFEMSVGKERMIVNCGAYAGGSEAWQEVQRTTAAHSTLALDDTNSSEILSDHRLGRRPTRVTCRREEAEGSIWIDASHDGYVQPLGVIHRRRIYLAAGGDDLRGEDTLLRVRRDRLSAGRTFIVRFHLHPDIQVSLVQNGAAALLRLPGGGGWRLRAQGASIGLSESIYLGVRGEVRRSEQVILSGEVGEGAPAGGDGAAGRESVVATVKWALARVPGRD